MSDDTDQTTRGSVPVREITLGERVGTPKRRPSVVTAYFDGTEVKAVLPDGSARTLISLRDAPSYTAANIAAIAHAVNTTGKVTGLIVFDTTNNRFMRASGATAASAWRDLVGGNAVTPA